MSRRRSSSRTDSEARPSPWPWLLAIGPAFVVVASVGTAWVAYTRADPVVADNYYRLGLTINRTLAANPPVTVAPSAELFVDGDGHISLRLRDIAVPPRFVRITLRAPGVHEGGTELLTPMRGNVWSGSLRSIPAGRLIVTIDSDAWRLPVTVVERVPATVRIAAGPHA